MRVKVRVYGEFGMATYTGTATIMNGELYQVTPDDKYPNLVTTWVNKKDIEEIMEEEPVFDIPCPDGKPGCEVRHTATKSEYVPMLITKLISAVRLAEKNVASLAAGPPPEYISQFASMRDECEKDVVKYRAELEALLVK